MRRELFAQDEYYHIFNRGVDKRNIFDDKNDIDRFFKSMKVFNTLEPTGGIYQNSFEKHKFNNKTVKSKKLVEFVAYCLNPNHYHFFLKQVSKNGVEKFMHRLSTGYTMYYNKKNKRTGSLFGGRYKFVHIKTDNQFFHTSVYVNLNYRVHGINKKSSSLFKTSWFEHVGKTKEFLCNKKMIDDYFGSIKEYKKYANDEFKLILEAKKEMENVKDMFLE